MTIRLSYANTPIAKPALKIFSIEFGFAKAPKAVSASRGYQGSSLEAIIFPVIGNSERILRYKSRLAQNRQCTIEH
jgi:hypothetical protein